MQVKIQRFFKRALAIALLSSYCASTYSGTSRLQDTNDDKTISEKPNIIFIVADDLGWQDVGFMGSDWFETPNLDSLASQSLVFNQAYMYPTCSPSRAAFMSGQHSFRTGVYMVPVLERGSAANNLFSRWTLPKQNTLYSEVLDKHGYALSHIGKWHLVGPHPEQEQSYPFEKPLRQPSNGDLSWLEAHQQPAILQYYPTGRGYRENVAGTFWGDPARGYEQGYRSENGGYHAPFNNPFLPEKESDEWLTDRLTDEAIDFIARHKDVPFFINLNFYAPHRPTVARSDASLHHFLQKSGDKQTGQGTSGNNKENSEIAAYATMIASIDENVKRLIDYLDANNLRENTLVIFTSDNGFNSKQSVNKRLRGSKGSFYEGGIRVPFIASWPKTIKPGVSNTPVSGLDYFPTFLELANISPKNLTLDGNSLLGLMQGKNIEERALIWHLPSAYKNPPATVIRRGKWKLIQYLLEDKVELYDIENDLAETTDLSQKEQKVARRLLNELSLWRKTNQVPLPPNAIDLEHNESYLLSSPKQVIDLLLSWGEGDSPQFSITFDDQVVVLPSTLDLLSDKTSSKSKHELRLLSQDSVNEAVPLPWGQFSQLQNQYNGAKFALVEKDTGTTISIVEFRVFDDAVAFRHLFESSEKDTANTLVEDTSYRFAQDGSLWSYNGMKPTKHTNRVSELKGDALMLPLSINSDKLPALAFQEAARIETAMLSLSSVENSPELRVISEPIDMRSPPSSTSWRVLQIADKAGDLLTSQVLMNLSPPNRIPDSTWIKSGKSLWDWRVRGQQYADHTYALDNESLRRMITFAAKKNMQYVMIDANWYGPEHKADSDPFTEIESLSIKDLITEAKQQGIGFILYLNDKASINHDLDSLFETWSSWGAAGVKYGFMKAKGKEKVRKTLKIVELAAKHKLVINFHDGPVVPSGLRRTWPNWLTREAVHAQADGRLSFQPSGFIQMAHVNGLAGPLDMSNGFFKLDGLVQSRNYVKADVNSTVSGELARALIIYSGLIIFPDAPEEYLAKKDLFEFFEKMPATWDESKVLSSDIHSHIVTARRSGEDWFIGAAVNEQGGSLPLDLSFLEPNKTYVATLYADAPDAHYISRREAYEIRRIEVDSEDKLSMILAPGGGQAIWLRLR